MSIWDYRQKIRTIIRALFALLPDVLPVNLAAVDGYMQSTWFRSVDILLRSVEPYPGSPSDEVLRGKIQSYVDDEEANLVANLETVEWVIDASNVLNLITGTTRTEHVSMPSLAFCFFLFQHFFPRSMSFLCCTSS